MRRREADLLMFMVKSISLFPELLLRMSHMGPIDHKIDHAFILTLKVPFTTLAVLVASVDKDQAAQNMRPDL